MVIGRFGPMGRSVYEDLMAGVVESVQRRSGENEVATIQRAVFDGASTE